MSSGYSSSAIRERIYFGDDMSGVLLYTGSADKEGSLGGLVELGNIDQLIVLMKDAFQETVKVTCGSIGPERVMRILRSSCMNTSEPEKRTIRKNS